MNRKIMRLGSYSQSFYLISKFGIGTYVRKVGSRFDRTTIFDCDYTGPVVEFMNTTILLIYLRK